MKKFSEDNKPSKPGDYNIWFSNIRTLLPLVANWDGEKWNLESWAQREGKDLHFHEPITNQ
jgi:hypothetical protein